MPANHLIPVLTGLGIQEERAAQLVSDLGEEEVKGFKPEEVLGEIRTGFETRIKNDPEFINNLSEDVLPEKILKSIESKQYGRAANITRQNIMKAFGFSEQDFADLGEEGKKIEVFARAAADKYASGKATDKELQKSLLEARKQIEKLQAEEPEKLSAIEKKYQTEMSNKMLDFIVLSQVAQSKGLKVPAAYISDKIVQKLKDAYELQVTGLDAKLLQKNNPRLEALDGNDILTLPRAIQKILEADGLIEKGGKEGGEEGKETGVIKLDIDGNGGEGLKVSSHIADRLKKSMEAEKKAGAR